ncbi:MAG: DUF87 domain-containing protein [Fimbriimonadales bacterium]|nr:DUF87 domain-containing protein [Fimbriimonadales bacterium]
MRRGIGFVVDIYTRDGKTYIVLVLDYRELKRSALKLGQFVKICTGTYYENRAEYLGMVTNSIYRPVTYDAHAEALALRNINQAELDEHTAKNINFLHYEIVILGRYTGVDDKSEATRVSFYPSTRTVPSLLDVSVSCLDHNELEKLINVTLQPTGLSSEEHSYVDLGHLRLGSDEDGRLTGVKKRIDIANFHGRRTANFGKTGFGKSNENKVILVLLKYYFPEMGMLIFDLNGEYATQTTESTSMGLIQAFEQLEIQNQIVWFTNRQVPDEDAEKDILEVKPIKINFFREPYLAIELAYQRELFQGGRPPQYLEAARSGVDPENGEWIRIPNKMAYVYGALLEAGLKPPNGMKIRYADSEYEARDGGFYSHETDLRKAFEAAKKASKQKSTETDSESDGEEKRGSARELYQYAKRLSFLKDLHTDDDVENFIDSAVHNAISGKVVIIDLPTVRPEQVEFISSRLAARLFNEALQRYTQGIGGDGQQQKTDVLVVIEEAHNLLAEPSSVFYRIAKEGRKYGIGMLYSTQSPSGIPMDILAQTENFLVKHVSSEDDAKVLKKAKVAFAEPISDFILNEPVVGLSYVYMEPYQPFPVPVQVRLLEEVIQELRDRKTRELPSEKPTKSNQP